MFTWCYCLNVTLLTGLHSCTLKSNDCISMLLKAHEILLLPFWEGPPMQTLCSNRANCTNFLCNQTRSSKQYQRNHSLQGNCNSTKRKHSYPQNPTLCHHGSPFQGHTMPPSLCQTSAHGCCWGRDLPLCERAAMHEARGKERPFATSRMRHNSVLREWS